MLADIGHGEDGREGEEKTKSQTDGAATTNVKDRGIARGRIEEGAVRKHVRLVLVEGEIALGVVGKRAIGVEGVVVVIQGSQVEVDFIDDHVGGVRAWLEGEQ